MASVTLTTLRARARERADMTGSSFVADAATGLDAWINEANQQLYKLVVEAMGETYFISTATLNTVAGTSDYNVPSGIYKLLGVDLNWHGKIRSLERFSIPERNVYREDYPDDMPRYALVGSSIRLYPIPQGVYSGTVHYVPEATILSSGSDTVSYPNGWEAYIVASAAMQALMKEESSVNALALERDRILASIMEAKEARDMAQPIRVVDTSVASMDPDIIWRG